MSLSQEQQAVINALTKGDNVFVTGAGGTGKSYLIDAIRKQFRNCSVTSSTGISALNIGGQTIHRWSGIGASAGVLPVGEIAAKVMTLPWNADKKDIIRNCRLLIVDEISMLDAGFIDTLDKVLRNIRRWFSELEGSELLPFGGIQVAFFGDFLQLPPVNKNNSQVTQFAFEANVWQEAEIKTHLLTKVFRQENQIFSDMLNRIRIGEPTQKDILTLSMKNNQIPYQDAISPIEVFAKNAQADLCNSKHFLKLPDTKIFSYTAQDIATPPVTQSQEKIYLEQIDKDCIAPKVLTLKKDAQVMLLKNVDPDNGFVNGSIGKVVDFIGDTPIVLFTNGKTLPIDSETWELKEDKKTVCTRRQLPLRLSYGITIHKVQGMTLDSVMCDLSGVFEDGQAYVALSRAKTLDGLYLKGFSRGRIFSNKKCVNFYRQLKEYNYV